MDRAVIIEMKDLTKRFGGLCAVDGFSGFIMEDQIVGIIGPNGAGKTTILNMVSGVYPPSSGEIIFKDTNLCGVKPHNINRMGVARTFQNIRLFEDLTVLQTVMTAYSWRAPYHPVETFLSLPRVSRFDREIREKSMHWLEYVGIADQANKVAKSLPYGIQRRVEIARALASEPIVLLLDEPGAGLNPTEIQGLVELIKSLSTNLHLSILLIDHRMEVIMSLCEWIYVQNFGKKIAQGTPDQVQNNPVVIKAYLGEDICYA